MKICMIDDNESISKLLAKSLKMEGHEVEVFFDGESGLSALENNSYDAVFLDIMMPKLSGIDVVNALNKSGKIKEHNIVIMTASVVSDDELNHLKESGVKEIVSKPFSKNDLLGYLEKVTKN